MADGRIQVVAGVLVRDGRVLICQRPEQGDHALKWEFPGGKVEPGESLEEALRRELREELAIESIVGRTLWRTEYQYTGRAPFVLTFFLVAEYSGALTNRVFAALRWADPQALSQFDFLEGDREFITQIEGGRIALAAVAAPMRVKNA